MVQRVTGVKVVSLHHDISTTTGEELVIFTFVMEAMVERVTGVKVVSMHHDISTKTGEELVIFTLAAAPLPRSKETAWLLNPRQSTGSRGIFPVVLMRFWNSANTVVWNEPRRLNRRIYSGKSNPRIIERPPQSSSSDE